MAYQLSRDSNGVLVLAGSMDNGDLLQARREGERLIAQSGPHCVIRLDELQDARSVTLSLLLTWLRHARQSGVELSFGGMPDRLRAMAVVSGLDEVIPHQD